MEVIDWIRSLPAWFLSIVEPIFIGFGLDAYFSIQQFLFIVAVALFFLVIIIVSYLDRRD